MPSRRYQLGSLAGRGGMGSVYQAIDCERGVTVALKQVRTPSDDLREADLLARVDHPNVVRLVGVDRADDGVWLVSEWVSGRSLAELRPIMGPVSAACCMHQVFAALEAVHARGIVHRDLKPANVMLGHDGVVKLIDFGVAFHAAHGSGDTIAGSPRYMDPRLVGGRGGIGPGSDLYAAGLMLLELMSGAAVWPELALLPLHRFIQEQGVEHLRARTSALHPELGAIASEVVLARFGGGHDAANPCGRLAVLLEAWGVRDGAAHLATCLAADDFSDAAFAPELKAEAQTVLSDPRRRAREKGEWLGYASHLGVAPASRPDRRGAWRALARLVVIVGIWVSSQIVAPEPDDDPSAWAANATPKAAPNVASPPVAAASPPQFKTRSKAEAPTKAPRLAKSPRKPALAPTSAADLPVVTKVFFAADAWGDLFINGKSVGRLPRARPLELAPGAYELRFTSPLIEPLTQTLVVPPTGVARYSLETRRRVL